VADNDEWRIRVPDGFERRELSVNGIRTVVYCAGTGRPVVYWHGGGTFHGIDFARDWAPHFRIILPHHPGFGESGEAPGFHSLRDYHRHYLALFDCLGLAQVDLIGLSLGGWLAAEFAAEHGDRVRRLVLVASPTLVSGLGRLGAVPLGGWSLWTRALLGRAAIWVSPRGNGRPEGTGRVSSG